MILLNHAQTIPSLLSPWKYCLLRKQSLVPERLETAGRDNRVCHCHKFRKTSGYPEEISLLTQKIEFLLGYRTITQLHNSDLGGNSTPSCSENLPHLICLILYCSFNQENHNTEELTNYKLKD